MNTLKYLMLTIMLALAPLAQSHVIDNFDVIGGNGFNDYQYDTAFTSYEGDETYILKYKKGSGTAYMSWAVEGTLGGNRGFATSLETKGISYKQDGSEGTWSKSANNGRRDNFLLYYQTESTDFSQDDVLAVDLQADLFGGPNQKIWWTLIDSQGNRADAWKYYNNAPEGFTSGEWFTLTEDLANFDGVDLTDIVTVGFTFKGITDQDVTLDMLESRSISVLEPSTVALMSIGLAGLCFTRKRV